MEDGHGDDGIGCDGKSSILDNVHLSTYREFPSPLAVNEIAQHQRTTGECEEHFEFSHVESALEETSRERRRQMKIEAID